MSFQLQLCLRPKLTSTHQTHVCPDNNYDCCNGDGGGGGGSGDG